MLKTTGWLAPLLLVASTAHASSTDMQVSGTIKPGACTVAFEGDGYVDFGELQASELSQVLHNPLPKKYLTYSIQCSGPMPLGMHWADNRPGSAPVQAAEAFGLGLHKGERIGSSVIVYMPDSLQADGEAATLWRSNGGPWKPTVAAASTAWTYGYNADPANGPAAHASYAGTVMLSTVVVPLKDLDQSEQIKLDGSSTLWLEYI